jgi:hypothetical protein
VVTCNSYLESAYNVVPIVRIVISMVRHINASK